MEVNDQLYAPAAIPLGKNPMFQFDKKLDGLRSRSGHYGEKKNIIPAGI
jgi:hypothetical protein